MLATFGSIESATPHPTPKKNYEVGQLME